MTINMMYRVLLLLVAVLAVTFAQNVTNTYKTCAESTICSYLRNKTANPNEFEILLNSGSISTTASSITIFLLRNNAVFQLTASFIQDGITRLTLEQQNDPTRYYLEKVLDGVPQPDTTSFNWILLSNQVMVFGGSRLITFNTNPFFIEIFDGSVLIALINEAGRLTFDSDTTSRAIGFDISFPISTIGYGLPIHADQLYLRQTQIGGEDPYRLHNLHVEYFGTNSTQALNGAVPVLYAYGASGTSGVFFHNGYETWVDIDYSGGNLAAHFMAQDGIFDAFILPGPTPSDVYRQYVSLTGVSPVPPIWSLGYHHSVVPSGGQAAVVADLVANFDNSSFPIDSIWISEEAGNFIWNAELFPGAADLLQNLTSTGRRIVLSVNPFITADWSDPLFIQAAVNNYLVLAPARSPYIGNCYLGECSWWDFTNPASVNYFDSLFSYDQFAGTSVTVAGFWSVQNEPLDLSTEERILPPDNIHFSGLNHRDIHSIYSQLMNEATYEAMLKRDVQPRRPFVLTDAFFAGSQRYAAIHTGNNNGSWTNFQTSFYMCLSASLGGIPFCGSDVGGYTGNIDEELLVRWYQAAIWLPLFRSNNLIGRAEPYQLSANAQTYVRRALDLRYSILEIFYTLFYEHEVFRTSIIRPIFYQYPTAPATVEVQDGFLVGENILVYPVTNSSAVASQKLAYLPNEIWYDVDTPLLYPGNGYFLLELYPDRIPVFYRGGSIIPRRNGNPRSTTALLTQTFALHIFLNANQYAEGRIYFDDGFSFNYRDSTEYYYLRINYVGESITYTNIDPSSSYDGYSFQVTELVIYRPPNSLKANGKPISITPEVYKTTAEGVPLEDIKIDLNKEFVIKIR